MKMVKDKFIGLFDDQFYYEVKGVPLQTGPVYDDFVPLEATVCFTRLGKKVMWQNCTLSRLLTLGDNLLHCFSLIT